MKYAASWTVGVIICAIIAARMANSVANGIMIFVVICVFPAISALVLIKRKRK